MEGEIFDLLLGEVFGVEWFKRHAVVTHSLISVSTHFLILLSWYLAILLVQSVV